MSMVKSYSISPNDPKRSRGVGLLLCGRIERPLDFENVVLVEPMHLHDRARRIRPLAPQFFLDLVGKGPESKHVGDVYDDAHAIAQRRALRFGDQLHVEKGLANPGFVALDERIGHRVDSPHAGDVDEIARVARSHVPVGLMAPAGDNVLTPLDDTDCAAAEVAMTARIPIVGRVSLNTSHSFQFYRRDGVE